MMIRIYTQQLGAVEDLLKSLNRWNKQLALRSDGRKDLPSPDDAPSLVSDMDLDFIEETKEQIVKRKGEIEELALAADRSCTEVCLSAWLELISVLTFSAVARTFGSQATRG